MSSELIIALIVSLPFVGAALTTALGKYPDIREGAIISVGIVVLLLVTRLYPLVQQGIEAKLAVVEPIPGLPISFSVEPLGLLFCLVASFLWIVTTIYSIGYMRGHADKQQTRFYTFFAIAIGSVMGVALADNLFTLFIFYEVLTISTYPLVVHNGGDESRMGGRIYIGLLIGTSMAFFLPAIIWTWHLAGTVDFQRGGILVGQASNWMLAVLYALFVFGIGKAALMPFHRWLPAAMVAPAPVSALLHAVAVVKAGVFCVMKVSLYTFGIDLLKTSGASNWLMYLAAFTIITASIVAMQQDNLKARLAYSTISQLSYIILGATLANAAGVIGGSMHIAMHAFGKITLFFCAGAILVATHKSQISEMDGLGHVMPVTMGAFLVASLSIIGLPPLGGLWSKWYLALGTLESGHLLLLGVLMLSSLLNIAYLLPIPIRAFFKASNGPEEVPQRQEAPKSCLIAIVCTTICSVVLFIYPDPLFDLIELLNRS